MSNSGNGRRYDDQFKVDAIRMVNEEGRSVTSVAKDLGINDQTLRNWMVKEYKKQDPKESRVIELEYQLKEKQKRIDDLEDTVDILKKATAIFVQSNRK